LKKYVDNGKKNRYNNYEPKITKKGKNQTMKKEKPNAVSLEAVHTHTHTHTHTIIVLVAI